MRVPFLEAVKQRLLLGDGAMGTRLIEAGLPFGGFLAPLGSTSRHQLEEAAAERTVNRSSGLIEPRLAKVPAANSSESPGRMGVTTKPVSAKTIKKRTT